MIKDSTDKEVYDVRNGDILMDAVYAGEELVWPPYNSFILTYDADITKTFFDEEYQFKKGFPKLIHRPYNRTTFLNFEGDSELLMANLRAMDYSKSLDGGLNKYFYQCRKLIEINMSGCDMKKIKKMIYFCFGAYALKRIMTDGWDTSAFTTLEYCFCFCRSLESLNLSHWDVSNVEDVQGVFGNCESLKSLNVSTWNLSKTENFNSMFRACSALEELFLSARTSKGKYFSYMFMDCNALKNLKIPNFDFSAAATIRSFLKGCDSLNELDLSNAVPPGELAAEDIADSFNIPAIERIKCTMAFKAWLQAHASDIGLPEALHTGNSSVWVITD